jgi:predicted acetylornithine/succinylornithine family transaminase
MSQLDEYVQKEAQYHMSTYKRYLVIFVNGLGSRLWDINNKEYLDFVSGLGVSSIGHCHPKVVDAVRKSVGKLIHVSNLFYTVPQINLAEHLVKISFGDKVFFCNSGAEANEGAIKLVRKYAKVNLGQNKYEVITAYRSFHGRTFKTLAATGQPKKQKAFEPLPPGFKHVHLNNARELEEAISEKTGAVMLEPIQGEGGVYECEYEYLKEVREICNRHNLLLVLDEVQTGLGRTGKMFAYEHYDIEPDIITLAKGLAGGLPIGCFIAKEEIARAFEYGDHATTFGGGAVPCSAAIAALKVIEEEKLVENCAIMGSYLKEKLEDLKNKFSLKEIRGKGLMIGAELEDSISSQVVQKCLENGVVLNNIGENIIRFLPPLCITKEEIDKALMVFERALDEIKKRNI